MEAERLVRAAVEGPAVVLVDYKGDSGEESGEGVAEPFLAYEEVVDVGGVVARLGWEC